MTQRILYHLLHETPSFIQHVVEGASYSELVKLATLAARSAQPGCGWIIQNDDGRKLYRTLDHPMK